MTMEPCVSYLSNSFLFSPGFCTSLSETKVDPFHVLSENEFNTPYRVYLPLQKSIEVYFWTTEILKPGLQVYITETLRKSMRIFLKILLKFSLKVDSLIRRWQHFQVSFSGFRYDRKSKNGVYFSTDRCIRLATRKKLSDEEKRGILLRDSRNSPSPRSIFLGPRFYPAQMRTLIHLSQTRGHTDTFP